jgi:hypothetical protein
MAKVDEAQGSRRRSLKPCCLVSEVLEEMGLDSRKAREIRRQTLIGLMTFCQWQLARMDEKPGRDTQGGPPKTKGRRVKVV